uniref:hAT-like transposase RNase-H fold domain-containing protein n=1 Tax=Arundo donax TaxID=35708 RepID=A0A0A9CM89_ARUDO
MPFRVVEGEGFKCYSKTLEPRFDLPSRTTVARDCLKIYIEEKARLKKSMKGHRICLTTDTWVSIQNLSYMSLTAHWVDSDWNLHKRILNFCLVSDHKGETLAEKLEECLLEWDIGNIFTLPVDNASSNDVVVSYLKAISKDWEGVILKNEFLHIRCCAHIVNLIVKSGLKFINSSITKIRNVVRYVRSSPLRSDQFKRCVEKEKICDKSSLSLDVETRWNATYLMLQSAVKFEKAFTRFAKENKSYFSHFGEAGLPNALDWAQARELIFILKPFSRVTVRLSGSQYVTSSTFFHDFILLHDMLVQLAESNNSHWSEMATCMKKKFDKYWDNVAVLNPLLFMAVALDPRFKLKYLKFCTDLIYDQVKAKEFTSIIKGGLNRLFDWYVKDASSVGVTAYSHLPPVKLNIEDLKDDPSLLLASQFAVHLEEIESKESNSELSRFLKDKCEKI